MTATSVGTTQVLSESYPVQIQGQGPSHGTHTWPLALFLSRATPSMNDSMHAVGPSMHTATSLTGLSAGKQTWPLQFFHDAFSLPCLAAQCHCKAQPHPKVCVWCDTAGLSHHSPAPLSLLHPEHNE